MVKNIDSTYSKAYLEQVAANSTELNSDYISQLLGLLKYFWDLFGGTPGYWDKKPVNIELKTDSKPFHCKYYLFYKINKKTFSKD